MKILANSIPKSGTHLLLRLLTLLEFGTTDFGGVRPRLVSDRDSAADRLLGRLPGTREPGKFLGIGPHLAEGGRFRPARALIRNYGREKVTVGVEFPCEIGRRWLGRRLGQVPDGSVVSAHCAYTPELAGLLMEQKMRTVCILRDPRDTAVSHMHYLKRLPRHPIYREYLDLGDDHQRLMFFIRGGKLGNHTLKPLQERYRNFLDWEREGGAVMVRFEDLVGPKGGGTVEAQRAAIERVALYLSVEPDERQISYIQRNLFGSGRTFRKGRAGGWREEFSEEHVKAIKDLAGDLLVELEYEDGKDW